MRPGQGQAAVRDWGYDVGSYQFEEPYADEWGASVNASLLLEGMKAPIMLSVGFGENGAVTYASGSLAEPQRGDDYPTIGAAAGLERLKTQQNQYVGLDSISTKSATADVSVGGSSSGVAASGGATVEPAVAPDVVPCEPEAADADCGVPVASDPVTVTLNSVKADLIQWAADNTIRLLPATFGSADGVYTVIAVDDIHQKSTRRSPCQSPPSPITAAASHPRQPSSGSRRGTTAVGLRRGAHRPARKHPDRPGCSV